MACGTKPTTPPVQRGKVYTTECVLANDSDDESNLLTPETNTVSTKQSVTSPVSKEASFNRNICSTAGELFRTSTKCAEAVMCQHTQAHTVQDKRVAQAQLRRLGGPYSALCTGEPYSVWVRYPTVNYKIIRETEAYFAQEARRVEREGNQRGEGVSPHKSAPQQISLPKSSLCTQIIKAGNIIGCSTPLKQSTDGLRTGMNQVSPVAQCTLPAGQCEADCCASKVMTDYSLTDGERSAAVLLGIAEGVWIDSFFNNQSRDLRNERHIKQGRAPSMKSTTSCSLDEMKTHSSPDDMSPCSIYEAADVEPNPASELRRSDERCAARRGRRRSRTCECWDANSCRIDCSLPTRTARKVDFTVLDEYGHGTLQPHLCAMAVAVQSSRVRDDAHSCRPMATLF